ncbi:subclass B3 metallo-beta-lactamase [Solimonas variicoloris]|uniref:subclass B3 metallo-beta-lactamase n=1 Tax=Solimonas variicoloris TaxID=254408 RepID=UPI000382E319|nr:subclass B3 metallo-beta-lactamase [Solimonas variicoloris]
MSLLNVSLAPGRAAMLAVAVLGFAPAFADDGCEICVRWNEPVDPFRIYGDTYYVGARGLSSILITSPQGHVLIDGGLPETAPLIASNIVALGFKFEDVKLILNSHAHYDHAGGLAELARESRAQVVTSPWSANVLRSGQAGPSDPQYGELPRFPSWSHPQTVGDGETLKLGPIRITAHATGGHTPGGLSWTWQSCEKAGCLNFVYADSLTPVAAPGFHFSRSKTYPGVLGDFEHSYAVLEGLDCDVLLTPHPDASAFWQRREAQEAGEPGNPYVDRDACHNYVAIARLALEKRLAQEQTGVAE